MSEKDNLLPEDKHLVDKSLIPLSEMFISIVKQFGLDSKIIASMTGGFEVGLRIGTGLPLDRTLPIADETICLVIETFNESLDAIDKSRNN